MTQRRSSRPLPGLAPFLLALLAGLGLLSGCSGDDEPGLLGPTSQAQHEEFRHQAQRLLNLRARAVRDDDLHLFLATLDRSDPAFVKRQRRYFANMTQLPLARYAYTVLEQDWPDVLADPGWGQRAYLPHVDVSTQLAGYDTRAVVRLTGFAFAPVDGQLRIVSDRTRSGATFPGTEPAPWDLTRIHVRDSGSVLGVYDDQTWPQARTVNDAVVDGVYDLLSELPFSWAGRVVVYYFTNQAVLHSFDDVPGGNITHLGALTFPVYVRAGKPATAGSRFVLLRSSVRAGQPFLGRIVRHELTHVAIGNRDDGVPTWFAEGLAEYLGARDLPPRERRIATLALSRARQPIPGMPSSATFNGEDQEWNYALSWMAVDYVADRFGEAKVWALMRALDDGGRGTTDADQDAVLLPLIGLDNQQLAHQAARRILANYG